MIYADSNFIVSLYIPRISSERAFTAIQSLPKPQAALPFTWLHQVEVLNAFHRTAFETNRDPNQALAATAVLERDLGVQRRIAWVNIAWPKIQTIARDLTERHTSKRGYRTYDILHVATAQVLNAKVFWSFDLEANRLAAAEGLTTL